MTDSANRPLSLTLDEINQIKQAMKDVLKEAQPFKAEATSGSSTDKDAKLKEITELLKELRDDYFKKMKDDFALLKTVYTGVPDTAGKSSIPTAASDTSPLMAIQAKLAASADKLATAADTISTAMVAAQKATAAAGISASRDSTAAMSSAPDMSKLLNGTLMVYDPINAGLLRELKEAVENCCFGEEHSVPAARGTGGDGDDPDGIPFDIGQMENAEDTISEIERRTAGVANQLKGVSKESKKAGDDIKGAAKKGSEALWEQDMRIYANIRSLKKLESTLGSIQNTILGFSKISFMGTILKGVGTEDVQFLRNVRAVAYETQGITGDLKGMQRQYEDIGKTTHITGVDRSTYEKEYLTQLRRGIKDLTVVNRLTQAQLNTEKQLGMEAGSLSAEFSEWHLMGRMNSTQIADMGRGMRDVARFTGLTGENLKAAVQEGNKFIQQLAKAAQLTTSAAKNIIEITANAKKLGVADAMQPLMAAMTSSSELLTKASSQTKAFLFIAAKNAGRVGELMNGTILKSKQGIKDLAEGMEKMMKQFGVDSLEAIDNLSDESKLRLNLQLKAAFGLELGDARNAIETLKESSKGMAERLDALNKKQKQNLTLEEKTALAEEERRLKTSKTLEVLTALDEAAKGAKDMNQALEKFGTRRKEFDDDLKAMGISASSNAEVVKQSIDQAIGNINAGLAKQGKQTVKIDATEIEKAVQDPASFRELMAKLSKAEQQSATAAKASLDPMSKIEQTAMEINDTLRNYSQKALSFLMGILGATGILTTVVALEAGKIFFSLMAMRKEWGHQWNQSKRSVGRQTGKDPSEVGIIENLKQYLGVDPTSSGVMGTLMSFIGMGPDKNETPPANAATTAAQKAAQQKGKNAQTPPATQQPATNTTIKPAAVTPPPASVTPASVTPANTTAATPVNATAASTTASTAAATTASRPTPPVAQAVSKMEIYDLTTHEILRQLLKCVCGQQQQKDAKVVGDAAGQKYMEKSEKSAGDKAAAAFTEDAKKRALPISSEAVEKARKDGIEKATPQILDQANYTAGAATQKERTKQLVGQYVDPRHAVKVAQGERVASTPMPSKEELVKIAKEQKLLTTEQRLMKMKMKTSLPGEIGAMKLHAKTVKQDAVNNKVESKANKAGPGASATVGESATVEDGGLNGLLDSLTKIVDPKKLAMAAGIITVLGVSLVALGVAIIKMSELILGKTNMSLGKVAETAATVQAVIMAAALLATEAIAVAKGLEEIADRKLWEMSKSMVQGALTLLILTPAIVLLAGAILMMVRKMNFITGMNWRSALEIAEDVTAVIGVAGGMALAVSEAAKHLSELDKFSENTKGMLRSIMRAGFQLLILAPAIVFIAGALLKIVQWMTSWMGLDWKKAAMIGLDVAAIIVAAGAIAAAIVGASYGLKYLGKLSKKLPSMAKELFFGAIALLVVAPIITTLASAVIWTANKILGAFGLNAGKAAEVGLAVAGIILSAGLIAGAIIGAAAGLYALGILANWWFSDPTFWLLILLGGVVFMIMTPYLLTLASGVLYLAQGVMKMLSMDASKAMKIGFHVAGIILAAGLIAGAIIGAIAGLYGLGLLAQMAWVWIGMIMLGAAAMFIIAPAIIYLSTGILTFAGALAKVMPPSEMEKVQNFLIGWMKTVAIFAAGLIVAGGVLFGLGLLAWWAWWAIGLIWLGVKAFDILQPPLLYFSQQIIEFAKAIATVLPPQQAAAAAEAIEKLMGAIASVAWSVVSASGSLAILGALAWVATWGSVLLYLGVYTFDTLKPPMIAFAKSAMSLVDKITGMFTPEEAKQMAAEIKSIMESVGLITEEVMKAEKYLRSLDKFGKWVSDFFYGSMENGAAAFMKMKKPFVKYVKAVMGIAVKLGKKYGDDIEDTAENIVAILKVSGLMMEEMQKAEKYLKTLDKFESWSNFFNGSMEKGAKALTSMKTPFKEYVGAAIAIANDLIKDHGGKIEDVGEQIVEILKVSGLMVTEMQKAEKYLKSIDTILPNFVSRLFNGSMTEGATAFDAMKKPFKTFAKAALSIAKELTDEYGDDIGIIAEQMVAILKFIGPMVDEIKKAGEYLKGLTGFASWVGKMFTDNLAEGATAFDNMVGPVKQYMEAVLKLGKGISEKIDPMEAEIIAETLKHIGVMTVSIADAVSAMSTKLVPLMDKSWWSGQTAVANIEKAMRDLIPWFSTIASLIRTGIMQPILTYFPEAASVKQAGDTAKSVADMIMAIPPILDNVAKSIVPFTKGTYFREAPIKKVAAALPEFKTFFLTLAQFLDEGIITPILKQLGDPKEVKMAAETLKATAEILAVLPDVVKRTIKDIPRMIKLGPKLDKLVAAIKVGGFIFGSYATFFEKLFFFLDKAIISPILGILGDPKEIKMAADALKATVEVMKALPDVVNMTIRELPRLMKLGPRLDKFVSAFKIGGFIFGSYATFFEKLFYFLDKAIITPIFNTLGDPKEIKMAADALKATAEMLKVLPDVVRITIFRIPPLLKLSKYMDKLEGLDGNRWNMFFEYLFYFLDEGIITPILGILGDPRDMQIAAKSLKATADMLAALPSIIWNVIYGLIPMMGMYDVVDKVAPKEGNTQKFNTFFKRIFFFLNEGIIDPIFEYLGDPREIQMAGQSLNEMIKLLRGLPKFLDDLKNEMLRLNFMMAILYEDVPSNTKRFTDTFKQIGLGLGLGVFMPIKLYFPKPDELQTTISQLDTMVKLLHAIPVFLDKLSGIAKELSEKIGKMPDLGTNVKNFTDVFKGIGLSLGMGMIEPIRQYFPSPDAGEDMIKRLANMVNIILGAKDVINVLDKTMAELGDRLDNAPGFLWWGGGGDKRGKKLSELFNSIAKGLSGLISGVQNLPPSVNLEESVKKLDFLSKLLVNTKLVITSVDENIKALMDAFGSGGFGELNNAAKKFGEYFDKLAQAINTGIQWPVYLYFSDPARLKIMVRQLELVAQMIQETANVVKTLDSELKPLIGSDVWNIDLSGLPDKANRLFKGLGTFLTHGLMGPVMALPDASEINPLVEKLRALNEVLSELAQTVRLMAEISAGMPAFTLAGDIDLSSLESIGSAQSKPSTGGQSGPGTDKSVALQEDTRSLTEKLLSSLSVLTQEATKKGSLYVHDATAESLQKKQMQNDVAVTKDTGRINKETQTNTLSSLGVSAQMDRRSMVSATEQVGDSVVQANEKATDKTTAAINTGLRDAQTNIANTVIKNVEDVSTRTQQLERLFKESKLEQPVQTALGVPMAQAQQSPQVIAPTPKPPVANVQNTIERNQASTTPAEMQMRPNPQLEEQLKNAEDQLKKQEEMLEELRNLVEAVKPSTRSGETSPAGLAKKNNIVTGSPPRYGKLPLFLFEQSGVKGNTSLLS